MSPWTPAHADFRQTVRRFVEREIQLQLRLTLAVANLESADLLLAEPAKRHRADAC